MLGFSKTTVIRAIQNFQKRNSLVTQPWSGHPKLLSFEHQWTLKQIVENNNRKSAEQITNTFNGKTGLQKLLQEICMTLITFLVYRQLNLFLMIDKGKIV